MSTSIYCKEQQCYNEIKHPDWLKKVMWLFSKDWNSQKDGSPYCDDETWRCVSMCDFVVQRRRSRITVKALFAVAI